MKNFFIIQMLTILVMLLNLSNVKNPSAALLSSYPNNQNDAQSARLIDTFLHKCLRSLSIDVDCNLCLLCQNGAFCQQKPRKQTMFTDQIRTHLISNGLSVSKLAADTHQLQVSVNKLKSQIDLGDYLTCYCVPGYTGTYCQIDINECLSMPCSNNATCIDKINSYECKCPPGFTGQLCDIDINECDSSPCSSYGGTCVDLVDGYYCKCHPGFTGPSCSIDIDECASRPCLNNASCIDHINGFECNCSNTGYEGKLCEHNIDDCKNVKCQHGSVCVDGINSFKCQCYPGFTGTYCEIDTNECDSSPCMYGICWQNSDENSFLRRIQLLGSTTNTPFDLSNLSPNSTRLGQSSSNMIEMDQFQYSFDYTKAAGYWCECEPGYTGINCEIKINECESSPCGVNGKCIDLVNSYKCECYPGYTGAQCMTNINECELYSPCAAQSKCVDLKPDYGELATAEQNLYLNGYYCDCSDLNENLFKTHGNRDVIYAGLNCTLKLNACQTLKHLCQHDSTCQSILSANSNSSSDEQDIMCLCKAGYTGKYCQYSTTFRFDSTYSIDYALNVSKFNPTRFEPLNVKFDFRLNFFKMYQLPLIYFKDESDQLIFELIVHRMYLQIRNRELGLDRKLGFFYSSRDSYDQSTWNTLEIKAHPAGLNGSSEFEFSYSIRQFHLNVKRTVQLATLWPAKFVMGKWYHMDQFDQTWHNSELDSRSADMQVKSENYLNNACVRDFTINGQQLFKTSLFDYQNNNFETTSSGVRVKFGCNIYNEQSANQCNNEFVSGKNICLNNSTCANKWFDYECQQCPSPYYGKNCHIQRQKLVFLKPLDSTIPYLDLTPARWVTPTGRTEPGRFSISFKLHRIASTINKSISNLAFLLLRTDNNKHTYLVSIENDGYLHFKSIQTKERTDDFDLGKSFKQVWSLKNDRLNVNTVNTSYAVEISIKLALNRVELALNRTFVARYELVNTTSLTASQFKIETIRFKNFNSNSFNLNNNKNGFLLYDLVINENNYMFKYESKYKNLANQLLNSPIEMIVTDADMNFLQQANVAKSPRVKLNNLSLFNQSLDDFKLIDQLNKDTFYCDGMSTINGSIFFNRICFQSEHFNLIEHQKAFSFTSRKNSDNNNLNNNNNNNHADDMDGARLNLVNVTCEFVSRDDDSNKHYVISTNESKKNLKKFYSTCDKYSSIRKNLFLRQPATSIQPQQQSFVNYYFDFETTQLSQFIENINVNKNSKSSARLATWQNASTNASTTTTTTTTTTKLTTTNEDSSTRYNEFERAFYKQRRVITYQDVEFYSLEFNLNLDSIKSQSFLTTTSFSSSSSNNNDSTNGENYFKTNLFTLNTFDDLTTNRIFLFGLNLIHNVKTSKYELEIFTSKQSLKSEPLTLSQRRTAVNLTFTFNSIELRLNNNDQHLIRLTDRYFNLFFRSLLKAYGSFQLNVTSFEHNLEPNGSSPPLPHHLVSACMSEFKLCTRKAIETGYAYTHFNLIEQTRSVSYYQSDYYYDLAFEDSCSSNGNDHSRYPGHARLLFANEHDDRCFKVDRFDVLTSLKVEDFDDCEGKCNSSDVAVGACRGEKFWSDFRTAQLTPKSSPIADLTPPVTCTQASEYACFNNATCIDEIFEPTKQPFSCSCAGSYAGDRCERYDPCINNPCSVNSTCVQQDLGNDQVTYECKCHAGFLGRNCTIKFDETCLASPCLNGATCINVTSFDEPQKLSYECMCTAGYEGKRCETRIDYCNLYEPCKNGATCTNQNSSSTFYKCACAKGWKGVNCTQDIDECHQMQSKFIVPCSGKGQCINTMGSYRCSCNEYYYGINCEYAHICQKQRFAHVPCENGATCLVTGESLAENKYECKCATGYAGMNCSHPTCDLEPCQHDSICNMISPIAYACNCTGTGYAGLTCETLVNELECRQEVCFASNQTCNPLKCDCDSINCEEFYQQMKAKPREMIYHLILWPLLAIMLTLLIILFSIFGMKIKKSRATRGTYSPSRHEQQASRIEFNMDLKIPPEERLI